MPSYVPEYIPKCVRPECNKPARTPNALFCKACHDAVRARLAKGRRQLIIDFLKRSVGIDA